MNWTGRNTTNASSVAISRVAKRSDAGSAAQAAIDRFAAEATAA